MNTPNNKRRKESRNKIESEFIRMLQEQELSEITVTDICKRASVNRTTFYANYLDVYDLAEAVQTRLEEEVLDLYRDELEQKHGNKNFLKLFYHIKENPIFYKTYFKLNSSKGFRFVGYDLEFAEMRFDNRFIEYHIEFFGNGLNAVIRKWLQNDCRETPEEIFEIIKSEYNGVTLIKLTNDLEAKSH
ncbi:MAG: TetR/AcrR family transcriptional regulator [Clostridiales bacterium]|nr:TetR/AcrR family transcriptional regulator [Clostridiales bacterium]